MNAPILLGDGGTMSAADAAASRRSPRTRTSSACSTRASTSATRTRPPAADVRGRGDPLARRYAAHLMGDRPHLMGLDPSAVHVPTGIPNQFVMYANRRPDRGSRAAARRGVEDLDKIWSTPQATLPEHREHVDRGQPRAAQRGRLLRCRPRSSTPASPTA